MKTVKRITSLLLLVCLIFTFTACGKDAEKQNKYDEAVKLVEAGKYEEAYAIFESLGDFSDAKTQLEKFEWHILKSVTSDSDSEAPTVAEYEYAYNKQGLMEKKTVKYSDGRELYYKYKYTKDGLLEEEVRHYKDESDGLTSTTYKYDKDGNMTEKKESTKYYDQIIEVTNSYKYDKNGLMTEELEDRGYNKTKYEYIYDKDGSLIKKAEIHYHDDQEVPYGEHLYTYDKDGNMIKDDWTKGFVREFLYDDHGMITNYTNYYTEDSSKKYENTCEYQYNDKGLAVKCTLTYTSGWVAESEYEYVLVYKNAPSEKYDYCKQFNDWVNYFS